MANEAGFPRQLMANETGFGQSNDKSFTPEIHSNTSGVTTKANANIYDFSLSEPR